LLICDHLLLLFAVLMVGVNGTIVVLLPHPRLPEFNVDGRVSQNRHRG
jgi:hypothetical protein